MPNLPKTDTSDLEIGDRYKLGGKEYVIINIVVNDYDELVLTSVPAYTTTGVFTTTIVIRKNLHFETVN